MQCPPRFALVPDSVRSAGPQITRLAGLGGIRLDEHQEFMANSTAGVDADGRWSAFECVLFGPRQSTGKTEYLLARALAGLFLLREELVVYSAHQVKTATKSFRRLRRAIDRNEQLGARIARVSNRIGSETLELTTGQALECVARSTSSGRGFTGDCLLLDEAHELDIDALAAILPMLSTRPNPQVFYALSFADQGSTHVAGLRARALAGEAGLAWIEWSMADDDQVEDRAVWARCNPAVPSRVSWAYLEKEFRALGRDRFARERLGKSEWPSGDPDSWRVLSEADWAACFEPPGPDEDVWQDGQAQPSAVPAGMVSRFDPFTVWGPTGVPPWLNGNPARTPGSDNICRW